MVKASTQVTITKATDVHATYRYYKIQESEPEKPTVYPPADWSLTEPTYTPGSDDMLYFVDCTIFTNNTYAFSEVSKSSSYEAAKEAWKSAFDAQDSADKAQDTADDAQARVDLAQSIIQQVMDNISMLVTDESGSSLMQQTDAGWTFSTSNIQQSIDNISSSLSALNETLGDTEAVVSILQQSITAISNKTNYVNIGTWEGESCIELGESGTDFSVMITNTRILFRVGATAPTKITADGLDTDNIVVKDSLQQGNFIWKERGSGNYGLSRIGGS